MFNKVKGHKIIYYLILASFFIVSCHSKTKELNIEDIGFSDAEYYPSFLFVEEKNEKVEKTIGYEFNDYAKSNNSQVYLSFYNDKNQLLSDKDGIKFYVNGSLVKNNEFEINSKYNQLGKLTISIVLPPDNTKSIWRVISNKHNRFSGFIKFSKGDIDRINNVENIHAEPILSWSISQIVRMNPLQKWLSWLMIILAVLTFIYLTLIKPILFRRIKKRDIIIEKPFYKRIEIKGAISLTLSNQNKKQSILKKIFKGKEKIYLNPFFTRPIKFTHFNKNTVKIYTGGYYTIQPNTTKIKANNQYTIINNETKQTISIQ